MKPILQIVGILILLKLATAYAISERWSGANILLLIIAVGVFSIFKQVKKTQQGKMKTVDQIKLSRLSYSTSHSYGLGFLDSLIHCQQKHQIALFLLLACLINSRASID